MDPLTPSAFDLPEHLTHKADPALVAGDERHFAAIAESLEQSIADLSDRLDAERLAPGGMGQAAMDRDLQIHRLTARLRALRRFGLDLCLGHIVSADNPPTDQLVYIGRLGLTDSAGRRLLLDWRSPAAEPFFGATHATDDTDMHVMWMLRHPDLRENLVDGAAAPHVDADLLACPFAHIVVDEAQELTDAQWQMLLLRCPSRSFTIVGDRAQARAGFTQSWPERLERIGLNQITLASLSINYRTPQEVMAEAEPVIRAVLPDANVPTSIRSNGVPVEHGSVSELGAILDTWLAAHADGIAAVIGTGDSSAGTFRATARVRSLTPELSKGLEFDLVVLIDPGAFGEGVEAAVDRYVAMTRATQRLVILTSS